MDRKYLLYFFLLLFLGFLAEEAYARVYVVAGNTGGDGSSWGSALGSLGEAIEAGGENGEIWVAAGVYTPVEPLYPENGMSIFGGFAGNENDLSERDIDAHHTIIDGNNTLVHVFFIRLNTADVRLDGLIIRNGNADTADGWGEYGGGVFVDLQPAIIANCRFENNHANYYGGAIFCNRSATQITNCEFSNNISNTGGGGVAAYDADINIQDSLFSGNQALGGSARGGGLWAKGDVIEVVRCDFLLNHADHQGGGLEVVETAAFLLRDCAFQENSAETAGGAVSVLESGTTVEFCNFTENFCNLDNGGAYFSLKAPTVIRDSWFMRNQAVHGGAVQLDYMLTGIDRIERCRFIDNRATLGGGALHSFARSLVVENSIFSGNQCSSSGGAIRFHAGLSEKGTFNQDYYVSLMSCVVHGNSATNWGGGIACTGAAPPDDPTLYLYNSIFWNNSAGERFWDQNLEEHVPSKDLANLGTMSLETKNCDIETLLWEHGSATPEEHEGSFSLLPLFVDVDGADNIPSNEDDDFSLTEVSPCLDRAMGDFVPEHDILGVARFDLPGVENLGGGVPEYADIGCYEMKPPPVAGFSFSPTSGSAPLLVEFTDTSENSPTSWAWDFDDGESSEEQHPSHIFTQPGTYIVMLQVDNGVGVDGCSEMLSVVSCGEGPVRINFIDYAGLNEAYEEANDGDVLYLHVAEYYEPIFNRDVDVHCKGGYNSDYSQNIGPAVFVFGVVISSGTVIMENIVIQ